MSKIDARVGAPKNPGVLSPPPIHPGMSERSARMAGVGGHGHAVASGGVEFGGNQLPHAYGSVLKNRAPSPINRDNRSRNFDRLEGGTPGENIALAKQYHSGDAMAELGAAVLSEAVLSGSTKLPNEVTEK